MIIARRRKGQYIIYSTPSRHLISRLTPPASPQGEAISGLHCGAMLPQPQRRWDFTRRRRISPSAGRFHPAKRDFTLPKEGLLLKEKPYLVCIAEQCFHNPIGDGISLAAGRFHLSKRDFTPRSGISPDQREVFQEKGSELLMDSVPRWCFGTYLKLKYNLGGSCC